MGELKTLALNFSWARMFFAIKHDLLVCQDVSCNMELDVLSVFELALRNILIMYVYACMLCGRLCKS